eukprot:TRINITY_DN95575_c0_g1_i1.p1 TRINITY_DN95575_c0_g1~~TRINITY_DN95575_c0_g1_i1.p1  ORF type:complete len:383 (-),score=92.60 TRINITY_DN95575_c0_g1_i1:138-1286(-)
MGSPWDARARTLKLDSQGLTSVKGAGSCKELSTLSVQHNELTDLGELRNCRSLKVLNVSFNKLASLDSLLANPPLDCLNALIAGHNKIASTKGLQALNRLNTLVLSHNPLRDAHLIAGMKWLCKLTLSDCGLKSLPWLRPEDNKLDKLVELRLNHNNITSLDAGLLVCAKLKTLDVGGNKIGDEASLSVLEKLECLENLSLKGNPIDSDTTQQRLEASCPVLWTYNYRPTTKNVVAPKRKQFREVVRAARLPKEQREAELQKRKRKEGSADAEQEEVDDRVIQLPLVNKDKGKPHEADEPAAKRPRPEDKPSPPVTEPTRGNDEAAEAKVAKKPLKKKAKRPALPEPDPAEAAAVKVTVKKRVKAVDPQVRTLLQGPKVSNW